MSDSGGVLQEPSGLLTSVQRYYDQTWLDYRLVWLDRSNLAIHFGYYDRRNWRHASALANMNRFLANIAQVREGTLVLDAGCGVGGSCLWLAEERLARVTGITPVRSQVERARQEVERRGQAQRVHIECADYNHTGFPAASFDVVWALESLCHAANKAAVYREFFRLLRPGGRLVVAEYARTDRGLADHCEQTLRAWLNGWMIPDIDTVAEHLEHAKRAGFAKVVARDVTRNTWPSLLRLYAASFLGVPIDGLLCRLGLRDEVQHGNVMGSRRQYQALREGSWLYCVMSAVRP